MLRKIGRTADYLPVKKINPSRYIINFDKVDIDSEDNEQMSVWSQVGYYKKPTTKDVQADVVKYTIQRYKDEGLEPPKEEDIDVSEYVIE